MPEQPDSVTVDTVVMIVVLGALAIGLISMAVGKALQLWEYATTRLRQAAENRAASLSLASEVAQESQNARKPIATPATSDNQNLRRNEVADSLPEEVRDIIRFERGVEVVIDLLATKAMTDQARAIEIVFRCSRNSRAGSPYMRAKAAVEARIAPPTFRPLDDQHRATVAQN